MQQGRLSLRAPASLLQPGAPRLRATLLRTRRGTRAAPRRGKSQSRHSRRGKPGLLGEDHRTERLEGRGSGMVEGGAAPLLRWICALRGRVDAWRRPSGEAPKRCIRPLRLASQMETTPHPRQPRYAPSPRRDFAWAKARSDEELSPTDAPAGNLAQRAPALLPDNYPSPETTQSYPVVTSSRMLSRPGTTS